ncbi:MAG: hypothetical protein AAF385_16160, partial [Pseudomonadota bacterium]
PEISATPDESVTTSDDSPCLDSIRTVTPGTGRFVFAFSTSTRTSPVFAQPRPGSPQMKQTAKKRQRLETITNLPNTRGFQRRSGCSTITKPIQSSRYVIEKKPILPTFPSIDISHKWSNGFTPNGSRFECSRHGKEGLGFLPVTMLSSVCAMISVETATT